MAKNGLIKCAMPFMNHLSHIFSLDSRRKARKILRRKIKLFFMLFFFSSRFLFVSCFPFAMTADTRGKKGKKGARVERNHIVCCCYCCWWKSASASIDWNKMIDKELLVCYSTRKHRRTQHQDAHQFVEHDSLRIINAEQCDEHKMFSKLSATEGSLY